jgi:hypothetical protein
MDDSGRGVASQARRPGRRHACAPPLACTQNKWDGNGRPKAVAGRSSACRSEGARLWPVASREQPLHFAFQFVEAGVQRRASRIQYDPPARLELAFMQPDRLPHPSAEPVPYYRVARGAAYGEPDAGFRVSGPLLAGCREQSAGGPKTFVENLPKLRGFQQARPLGKREAGISGLKRVTWRNERLSRCSPSAFCGPSLDGAPGRLGRPWTSFFPGNHGSWLVCGYSAETYVLAC